MTSTVFISDSLVWSPKQWVLETIFGEIRKEALASNHILLVQKLDYATQARISDLKDLNDEQFRRLILDSQQAFHKLKDMSVDALRLVDDEEEHFEVLLVFIQFLVLLQVDNRSSTKLRRGLIIIDDLRGWKNKEWICDLIVKSLEIYTKLPDWTQKLSVLRRDELTVYDLSKIRLDEFLLLLQALKSMKSYFDGTLHVSSSNEITKILPPALVAFHEFIKSGRPVQNN